MKKVNVVTTMEVKDDATEEEIYDEFLKCWIDEAYRSRDLSLFIFTDPDTMEEIRDEDG